MKRIKLKRGSLFAKLLLLVFSCFSALLLGELVVLALGYESMYVSPERDRFWKYDPLLGWAHAPGQEGSFETPQFRTSIRINQAGLRGREHSYARAAGVERILVLGDSFAWGYGVEESQRFSEVLEASLGLEVINAGVSGYSTDQELLWLQSEGKKYDVDLVIVVLAGNDIGDNQRSIVNTIYHKPYFTSENATLSLNGTPVAKAGSAAKMVYFASQRSALVYFLVRQYFQLQSLYTERKTASANVANSDGHLTTAKVPDAAFTLTVELLKEMRKTAAMQSAEFLIVATDSWWNAPAGATYESFIEMLRSHDFVVLDVVHAAGFDLDSMIIADDGHWNAAGHEFVARELSRLIVDQKLLGTLNTD